MRIVDLGSASQRAEELCAAAGLEILEQKDIPYGRQFKVCSGGSTAQLNIYFGKKGLKLVVQGGDSAVKEALEDVTAQMEGRSAGEKKATRPRADGSAVVAKPTVEVAFDEPWIGTDESGKGDFFGPLVTAGVIVDPEAVPLLQSLGVDDSKKITDKKIPGMAEEIRKICFGKYKVLQINPVKYNELYGKMKNLNVLLAWTHAAVIEDLLEKQDVKLGIADKFGDEKYINNKLKTKGKGIRLIQVPKAEQNIAVAAASILARDALLKWSNGAKKQYGLTLPKGASSLVIQAGKAYVQAHGKEALANVAKLHFKTTEDVLR
ncbi:ribonuclease HIII [Tumebacillus permanentifrigoris]|uniref:Ribonuclease n=1 Tax=Tumebacillus permanentifrigoris TaxID=378543 RepID=A0A316DCZ0_9BACL|nr:ribonuclease HIII [Tumebacillus permanentifrigoris]PWK13338.1 ribonuclease HIII [Tumebacillus permanentifrigoris]